MMPPLSDVTVHQNSEMERNLALGRPLRIKYGIDPTAAHVHLGHAVGLLKLRQFQQQGHRVVLIIGDYTAQIGDPTGRDQTRPKMTAQEVSENSQEYLRQIGKIIDLSLTEVHRNGKWFGDMSFLEIINLISKTTVRQILDRNDFSERLKADSPIYLHECLYPIMQAFDSVKVEADVEIGGTEQLFNLMLARDFQKEARQTPQVCITVPILRGLDGVRRMGKSLNNYIGLDEPPDEMFAKVMSIPDSLMEEWWKLLPLDETTWASAVDLVSDPMYLKKALAGRIVRFFHDDKSCSKAAIAWHKRFSLRGDPEEIAEIKLSVGAMLVCELLVKCGLAKSKGEARRAIAPQFPKLGNSGVTIGPDKTRVEDPNASIALTDGLVVRIGTRKIVRVKVNT